jgi:hypothetical protein
LRALGAQQRTRADTLLDRSIGSWVAPGVSFQSGKTVHPFVVDIHRDGNRFRMVLPAELALKGGREYVLTPAGGGAFRHVDAQGRIVALELEPRPQLVITGTHGDGRVTFQLERRS